MLFLHLSYHKNCICCSLSAHKSKLHVINFDLFPILFSITFSTTFIACSRSLIALYDPHSNGSPLPLYTGIITLPFQSSGMVPSDTIALHSSVNHSTPTSSAA